MTRETKIGLLVGLAFIIVIGILLSDHMTSTTQPQQALLSGAAENVREGVVAPAPSQTAPPPVTAFRPITPGGIVPTQTDLRPPAPPAQPQLPVVEHVQIGGPAGGGPAGGPIVIRQSGGGDSGNPVVLDRSQSQPQSPSDIVPFGPVAGPTDTDPTAELQRWANAQQTNNSAESAPPAERPVSDPPPAPAAPAFQKEYVAQSGDNLSKLASRMLGSNSKANRDAILRANPTLQANPDLIVEGRKYKVPASVERPTAPPPVASNVSGGEIPETVPVVRRSTPVPVAELVDAPPAAPPAPNAVATRWYVAKDRDTLWGIAAKQLGDGTAWVKIKELNEDVLNGGEMVVPEMRLRLPARPVASAAD